jgi:hypothetical protein
MKRPLAKLGVAAGFGAVLLFGGAAANAASAPDGAGGTLTREGCISGIPCVPTLVDTVVKTWVDVDKVDVDVRDVDVDVIDDVDVDVDVLDGNCRHGILCSPH